MFCPIFAHGVLSQLSAASPAHQPLLLVGAVALFWDIQICRFCAFSAHCPLLIFSPLVIQTNQALCGPLILKSAAAV